MLWRTSLAGYRTQLERLKKYREALGLPESTSLQLLIDEVKVLMGEK